MNVDKISIISIEFISSSEESKEREETSENVTEDRKTSSSKTNPEHLSAISENTLSCKEKSKEKEQPVESIKAEGKMSSSNINADKISVISTNDKSSNEDSKEKKEGLKNASQNSEVSPWNILHIFSILTVSTVFASHWFLIPRTDSIVYQTHWFEVNIHMTFAYLWLSGNELINTSTHFKEKSMVSVNIFLRMFSNFMTIWMLLYLMLYFIWCILFGYNWPIPFLGYCYIFNITLGFSAGVWFVLPQYLRLKEGFKRNVQLYILYQFIQFIAISIKEVVSFLFKILPKELQWIVAFIIPPMKISEKFLRSSVVTKMTGGLEEESCFLVGLAVNCSYSSFVSTRLPGAENSTLCCFVAIDLLLQLQMTYKIAQLHNAVCDEETEKGKQEKQKMVKKLVLAEIIEGVTPLVYAIGFAMAYSGPNAFMFVKIGSNYWGSKAIEDPKHLFLIMLMLFGFDTFSVLINSIILRILTNVNLFREICKTIKRYWLFIAVKVTIQIVAYLETKDVNFGMDFSGKWDWITDHGRFQLINESISLSDEEKAKLLAH